MTELLALTITIPDWLLCPPFWAGVAVGIVSCVAVVAYAARNFSPFG